METTIYKIRVTWNDNGSLGLPDSVGTYHKRNARHMYFDTMREAERFVSQYLSGRTAYSSRTVEMH